MNQLPLVAWSPMQLTRGCNSRGCFRGSGYAEEGSVGAAETIPPPKLTRDRSRRCEAVGQPSELGLASSRFSLRVAAVVATTLATASSNMISSGLPSLLHRCSPVGVTLEVSLELVEDVELCTVLGSVLGVPLFAFLRRSAVLFGEVDAASCSSKRQGPVAVVGARACCSGSKNAASSASVLTEAAVEAVAARRASKAKGRRRFAWVGRGAMLLEGSW